MKQKSILILMLFIAFLSGQTHLEKANKLYKEGEYSNAVESYKSALSCNENPTIAHFNMANSLYQLDSIAQAIFHYQRAINESPQFFRPYLNLGILYFNLEEYGKTVAILKQGEVHEKNNTQLEYILATSYKQLERYDLAVPLFQKVLETDSSKIEICFFLYEIHNELLDYNEAKEWLKKYPDSGDQRTNKYHFLAELADRENDKIKALYYLYKLLEISPKERWTHYQIVQHHLSQQHELTAIHAAKNALDLFPDFAEIAILGGATAMGLKDYHSAEYFYEKANALNHSSGVIGLTNLSRIFHAEKRFTDVERITGILTKG